MAKKPVGVASALLKSIQLRPFCDHPDIEDLTPEQQAAMHAFLHEVMAAYFRMTMVVPVGTATRVLNARFAKALAK